MTERNKEFARRYLYYEILEVGKRASQDEIRQAYLKLARQYHPDVNHAPDALEKFKKINGAYEVLSVPARRTQYDASEAECPICGTDEVIQTAETNWRCRHCGTRFSPSQAFGIVERLETAAIPEHLRTLVRSFQATQCSWCSRFYTQPFLCPYGRLQSNCFSCVRLSEQERKHLLEDEKWWWRMADMIREVQNKGIMGRCRKCGALNPNPQQFVCWSCGKDSLCCPDCKEAPVLRYDIEAGFWKCASTAHGATYTFSVNRGGVQLAPSKEQCPACGKNLYYDAELWLFRCKNCVRVYTFEDLHGRHGVGAKPSVANDQKAAPDTSAAPPKRESRQSAPPSSTVSHPPKEAAKAVTARRSAMPKWMIPLLLLFALSVAGIAASVIIGTSIPFWLLFGFSVFFSAEKWFTYDTRKNKTLGQLYRTALNLSILSLIGLLVWSGIALFGQRFLASPLAGALVFLAEFVFFVWMWRIVGRNSWRRPSMKLTLFSLIVLFLVLAFAGVKPMSAYKDTAWNKIKSTFSSVSDGNTQELISPSVLTTSVKPVIVNPATPSQTIAPTTIPQTINSRTGVYKNYYLGLVDDPSGTLGGDGCYDDKGDFIVLINNKDASNPTYYQLVTFLQNDKVDQYPYTYTNRTASFYYGTAESQVDLNRTKNIIDGATKPSNPDVCADFAERLHNDAEVAGIRCAYVSLEMTGYTDPLHLGIPSNSGHACNAFQTTDRGLIYVDATGMSPNITHPVRPISTVNIAVGQQYIPISLFPEAGWQSASEGMGIVTGIYMTWDGNWNN